MPRHSREIVEELLANYVGKILGREAIDKWAYVLVDYWYNKYFTETFEPEEKKVWPDEKTKADVGRELSALPEEEPTLLIRGKPFEEYIFLILYVEGAAEE